MSTEEKDSLKLLYYLIPAIVGGGLLAGGIGILVNGGKAAEGIYMAIIGVVFLAVSIRQFIRKRTDEDSSGEE